MLISSFHLKIGTIITFLLLYYLHLGLECTKIHRFVQYNPKKCFSSFVQSAVNARRQGDENPNSSVVAETMKLLANSSYGYQIMDRSRHSVTKYLNDEKTHSAINNKLFKRLNFITDQLYEVELVKSEIEHREPIIVGFFILQYAELRILELYYNFFRKFCDTEKYEELEIDTDSLYLALSEKNLEDIILPEKRNEWEAIRSLRSQDCTDSFTANAMGNFFPRTCCSVHKKHDKRELGLFKEEFRCTVRAGSSPRRRPRLPPPHLCSHYTTRGKIIGERQRTAGGGKIIPRWRKNYPAAEKLSQAGAGA